jgi:hypothetical protein
VVSLPSLDRWRIRPDLLLDSGARDSRLALCLVQEVASRGEAAILVAGHPSRLLDFRRTLGRAPSNPEWVLWPVKYGLFVFLALTAVLIFYSPQGRIFAALFAVLNLYFMVAMTFLAGMAVTGDWL